MSALTMVSEVTILLSTLLLNYYHIIIIIIIIITILITLSHRPVNRLRPTFYFVLFSLFYGLFGFCKICGI